MNEFFNQPCALAFAGQGTDWRTVLTQQLAIPRLSRELRQLDAAARALLQPVAAELVTTGDIFALPETNRPAVSMPAIFLTQIGALGELPQFQPVATIGHSQGILAAAAVNANADRRAELLALAYLIGAGAERISLANGWRATAEHSPMLSLRGLSRSRLEQLDPPTIAVINGHDSFVLAATPSELEAFIRRAKAHVASYNEGLEQRRYGGSQLQLVSEFLPIGAPFHSPLLAPALELVQQWAGACGLENLDLAAAILTRQCDWAGELARLETKWILDLGPGPVLTRLSANQIAGSGRAFIDAATVARRLQVCAPGFSAPEPVVWPQPRIVQLPDGRRLLDTAFTRLTGRSPIMLPAMTPTTAWPEIVAAAANAGCWAELAGGGQYSQEVFDRNRAGLEKLLEPGRAAGFNAMFFDRFMWNLQFGVNRIVPKARQNGAPIDAVTIAAGIPELEEAGELLNQLAADGFTYICFKPGTVDQIRQVLAIAEQNPQFHLIMQVEDGHSGGHHSWENLDDLLLATYPQIRETKNVVLAVGGGIGTPAAATRYLTGTWSQPYQRPAMPVDAVFIGTATMAVKEARTSRAVKQLLRDTPGVGAGWVGRGERRGGITSGLSHLEADMHEVDNSSAAAARLIHSLDPSEIPAKREEIIAALAKTAKPYFGDLAEMTYAELANRFVELSHPVTDWTWTDRIFDLFQRIEARLSEVDHGQIETQFGDRTEAVPTALARLLETYPQAHTTAVVAADIAWFPGLCRKHPKPMPFVPVIDAELARWWGTDTLWQSHDERFGADAVRIIPGPVSVAGIDRIDEPIGEMFARYEAAVVAEVETTTEARPVFARLADAPDLESYLRAAANIEWNGTLVANPMRTLGEAATVVETPAGPVIRINCENPGALHAVNQIEIPIELPPSCATGGYPLVDMQRMSTTAYDLLGGAAGVGTTTVNGDRIEQMPEPHPGAGFGTVNWQFTLGENLGPAHTAVTGAALAGQLAPIVPDALTGPCWPAIYAALGSAHYQGIPVIEGLVNAVHLDHTVIMHRDLEGLTGARINVVARCASLSESSAGRVVRVELELDHEGTPLASMVERFAIRGRVGASEPPAPVRSFEYEATGRSFLLRETVTAPADMSAFAYVSGDFNPIHTSAAAAGLSGLHAPLVHGMWLSATAQHLVSSRYRLLDWTYEMYGMVNLGDRVEITVERVGHAGANPAIEVTSRIGDTIVSVGRGTVAAPLTAYVYPGQGIQRAGMGLEQPTAVTREIWDRADRFTRTKLGFSIRAIVAENPTEILVHGTVLRHPEGVLNLTQFTQVALATLAYAQTADLKARNLFVADAYFAGHSLGEYNALAACANIFPLEQVIEIVYQRGSAMHNLVERDQQGRSNYRLGALRPNQFGIGDADVREYVSQVAAAAGEFIEIVNYNLADSQYAVAGTVAGLAALSADAEKRAAAAGGKRPFMLIPGIDVPFHSSRLRPGVPAFRATLERLLPREIEVENLEGRYIPNLVARPFALTREFAAAIVAEVPSQAVADLLENWDEAAAKPAATARTLLVELLAWQFASPVRWIETQALLMRCERIIEIGLASAPTLAGLAEKTAALAEFAGKGPLVLNLERDAARVSYADTQAAPIPDTPEAPAAVAVETKPVAQVQPETTAATAPVQAAPDQPLDAGDAVNILLAYGNKIRPEQIEAVDTIETLTNGVSSKRNQLLMDIAAELGVPNIEGAAEADIAGLTQKARAAAANYRAFGPVLSEAINTRLRALLGSAGLKPTHLSERVTGVWRLPASWIERVQAAVLLASRAGESVRGGALGGLAETVTSAPAADELIDGAIQLVAAELGVNLAKPSDGSGAGGELVDSAALVALREQLTGILAEQARLTLRQLGLLDAPTEALISDDQLAATVAAELGDDWLESVKPAFESQRAVLLDDRWALAREELARIHAGALEVPADGTARFAAGGRALAELATWYARSGGPASEFMNEVAQVATKTVKAEYGSDVALVTGAAPGSIAAALVADLLRGGATVIMTASQIDQRRLNWAKQLYRDHALIGAKLWLVPANLASLRDIDALIDWIGQPQTVTAGAQTTVLKPALLPSLFIPFAAPPVSGTLGADPKSAISQERILVWGVERAIARLAQLGTGTATDHRVHVILPGSPNRGTFGGDGAYGEAKSAFDAIVNKWRVERGWSERVTLAHPRIGWVRGTHLMGGNDFLVPLAEKAGIEVYTPAEISGQLLELATPAARTRARQEPLEADLTGGLAKTNLNLAQMAREARAHQGASSAESEPETIAALPNPVRKQLPEPLRFEGVQTPLRDQIVIVGLGEIGTWGFGRTRAQMEYEAELTAAGVIELAWMMGLISWADSPKPGWVDEEGNPLEEAEIFDRYRDRVVARSGIRTLCDDATMVDQGSNDVATVYLETDQEFTAANEADARAYRQAAPDHTEIWFENGEWRVRKLAGAAVRVPRRATLSRTVGGQIPQGFDPAKWGIPANMIESLDRIAVWNLVSAVDAFISSGFTPAELLQVVHPAEVSSTQGTGIGGMESLRKVFLDRFLGAERPQDILQEALPNVVAAHTMQAYIGGYGQMIHPVGACATAAVSIEEAVDKIRLDKASFVVAGGIDDISVESLTGFGDMNATAESAALRAKGIAERHYSRAGDRRRGGFLEAEGGGTVLLTRGDIAAQMGLPVLAVLAYAQSFADGAHTSIPAPGIGALAAGRGGEDSALARALSAHGLSADDINVVSKHDTSTNANDPNEAELHSRLARAIGRQPGNPLYVISQKTVTGHAKGGAALFQVAGLIDAFTRQELPGNRSLDCLDPVMREHEPLVWLREPLPAEIRAGILTSLGFGHVAALILLTHPGVFEAALEAEQGGSALQRWRQRAGARLEAGQRRIDAAMRGGKPLFEPIKNRRMPETGDVHELEAELLLDPHARLGADGTYGH